MADPVHGRDRLRRELGVVESYAVLLGALVGAGIFRVTSEAWRLTGPGVIVGYVVLLIPLLSTAMAYAVFLSTPLGRRPGGEYEHLCAAYDSPRLAFIGAWFKIISYVGALAYLAHALADYVLHVLGRPGAAGGSWLATGALTAILVLHVVGVRWFGRAQVAMFSVLAVSLVVLVIPGLFHIEVERLTPVFPKGASGFLAALPPLFFAYAGFESIAQAAGEVKESTRVLPKVFLRGILATTAIFVLMSLVTLGGLPPSQLAVSTTPMADAASQYLPRAASAVVGIGAVLALTTSLNATMLVPSRLAIVFADDGLVPRWVGAVSWRTGTPVFGLVATWLGAVVLLHSGQVQLTLNVAVMALVVLYLLHSGALLVLPHRNPALAAQVRTPLPPAVVQGLALVSILSLGVLVIVGVGQDLRTIADTTLLERFAERRLTSMELMVFWGAIGLGFLALPGGRRGRALRSTKEG